MKIMKLKKGGRFMARWPETQFYYWSTLIEQVGDNWKVQFADGTIAQVKESDLHESLPADARNRAGRVTRSSPIKNLKRPEEISKSPARKSPARKVRKLFTKEENIKLGAELSAEIADSAAKSGDSDAGPSLREQSVSMSKATEDSEHGATDDSSPSRESSISVRSTSSRSSTLSTSSSSSCESLVGVSVETKRMTHYENPYLRERSVSVSRERADRSQGAASVQPSPLKSSYTLEVQKENVTHSAAGVQPSPLKSSYTVEVQKENVTRNENPYLRERSVSVSRERADRSQGAAGVRPSPLRSSHTVEVQKETVTRNTTSYTESYLDRDFRRQLWNDGSIGSADLRSSPMKGSDSTPHEREKLTHDVKTYAESFLEKDFRRQLFQKEGSVGSANLRPSPIRGSYSLLTDRGKVTTDLKKYTESYLDRGICKQLGREGSVGSRGILPSTYRRSVSVTKETKTLTGGIPLPAKYSLKDNEKKYRNKYPMEFGGRFGTALLILLLPLYIMSVFVFKLIPDPTKFEVVLPKRLSLIPQVAFGVIMLLSLQAILTTVPIGAVASGPLTKIGILSVRCNGIFAVVLTLVLTSAACYFEREVAGIVLSVYTEAAVSALLLGIIIALILYKRASKLSVSYLNPYGSTGFKLYDFWMGREVTPSIGKFNIKLIIHRFSVIIAIALNVLIVSEAYRQGVKEDILKSLMVSTVMQTLYCLHFLLHEDIYLYSFLALSEGVGYMITVGFMTYPFLLTLTTKVILDYRLKASLTETCIALFGYTVGYVLLESSSNRKTRSVRDPTTSVWKMKVVPEWSASVHTRAYLGEMIIYWAFAMLAGTTYLGVFTIPAGFTFSVLSRAFREYTRYVVYQGEVNAKKF